MIRSGTSPSSSMTFKTSPAQNDSLADIVKDEGTEVLFGQDYFYEELLGLKFKITPFSFFQTNSLGAEVLYEKAREYIGDTNEKVVFDLYSCPVHLILH